MAVEYAFLTDALRSLNPVNNALNSFPEGDDEYK